MTFISTLCPKFGVIHFCKKCTISKIIKSGKTNNGKQRYYCKNCSSRFIEDYTYPAYQSNMNNCIISLTKEGVGIRSTARLLHISPTTLLSRIISIAKGIASHPISKNKIFQVDEMKTYIREKSELTWIVYTLEQDTKNIVSFNVGRRTNKTLKKVITSLELSNAKRIVTDKLKHYRYLRKKFTAQNAEELITLSGRI